MFIENRVRSYCINNDMRPKHSIKLHHCQIIKTSGSGTYINETCIMRVKAIGSVWCELEVVVVGNTDCSNGLRFSFSTDLVLSHFDVDGYETCTCCCGRGVIKSGFKSL